MKKQLITMIFALAIINISTQTTSDSSWLFGSWGVRLIVEEGVEFDKANPSNDWINRIYNKN